MAARSLTVKNRRYPIRPESPRHKPVRLPIVDLGRGADIGARCDGKPLVVIGDHRLCTGSVDREIVPVGTRGQHGQRAFPSCAVVGAGIEVEIVCVFGFVAVAESVPPPCVLTWVGDPDMVGDDVDDQPHTAFACGVGQRFESGTTAEPLRHRGRVGHVVSVSGSVHRGQHR